MRKQFLYILAVAAVFGFTAVEASYRSSSADSAATDSAAYVRDSLFGEKFLTAMQLRQAGKADSALMYIDSCLTMNPNSAVAHFMRAEYYSDNGKDSLALQDFEAAAKLEPSNSIYQERVAQSYIGIGNYAKATEAYEKLFANHRDRDDVLGILIQLYRQQRRYDRMLGAIEKLEQIDGESDQLSMMKMNAYELSGDEKGAYNTLKGLADSHPNDANFKLMLGNWLMQHKRTGEAYDIYQSVLKTEPDNAMAQSAMYDYYNATDQDSLAEGMMNRILLGKETPAQTRIQFLSNAIQHNEAVDGDSTVIINLIDRIQQIVPRDSMVAQVKAAYYTLKKLPTAKVDSALVQLLDIQPDNAGARVQLIQDKWGSQNWAEIAKLSEPGMLYNPNEMAFYFFTGLSRYYLKDDDGALDALKRGTSVINDQSNPDLVSDLYSIMGEIYQSKNQMGEAFAAFDSCLQYKPDNVPTLNNYAYFLSLEGKDLDKAERMSAKAIAAEPKNATYLDTYAWVLYRMGRYADAKIYIDQTLKFSTDSTSDGTLYVHAAEIYAALGDYRSAVGFCQQAVSHGGDAKAMERKIKVYRKKIK